MSEAQDLIAFVLRLNSQEIKRQLYTRRSLYVGLRRDWTLGSRILFALRSQVFIGSGIIGEIISSESMNEKEKDLCLQNNWHIKMVFEKLTRFHPPVPVQNTPVAAYDPLALHGAEITTRDAEKIEQQARCKIIT